MANSFNGRLNRPSRLSTGKMGDLVEKPKEAPPPPPAISDMDYWQCLKLFKCADIDCDGILTEKEFGKFLGLVYPNEVWSMDTASFFRSVDVDGSGELSLEEFIGWVYQVPEVRAAGTPKRTTFTRTMSSPSLGSPASPTQRPTSAARLQSPASPKRTQGRSPLAQSGASLIGQISAGEVIAFEIVCDEEWGADQRGALSMLSQTEAAIKERMQGRVAVKRKIIKDSSIKGCMKVTALLGTGIVLWDKGSMMAFKEDPFKSYETIRPWTRNMAEVHVPLLFRVLNR